MTKKRGADHGKRRLLTEDDEALWEHAARSLKPLRTKKGRVHAGQSDDPDETPPVFLAKPADAAPTAAPPPPAKRAIVKPAPPPSNAPRITVARAPAKPDIDPKAARKLRRGHLEIEARIDLHGMRQAEAHAALRGFIRSAHAAGKRWVLVITGKGKTVRADRDDIDGWLSERETGVLKRNVPQWLAEPEMHALVVGFREAAIEHGGAGALYVHVRKRK